MAQQKSQIQPDASGLRIGIAVSRYHAWATEPMQEGAVARFVRLGGDESRLTIVPAAGAWELVAAAEQLMAAELVDAVVALGVVIRGETPHFDYICQGVTQGLVELTARKGIPVGYGVLTCDTTEQVKARVGGDIGNKGADAMEAAVLSAVTKRITMAVAAECDTGGSPADPESHDCSPATPVKPHYLDQVAHRRAVRLLALQMLYQIEARHGEDLEDIEESLLQACRDPKGSFPGLWSVSSLDNEDDHKAAIDRAQAAWGVREEADRIASQLAPEWPSNRQPAIDRNIIRLCWHEMNSGAISPKAAVNEAIILAKSFGTDRSAAFVNGVLDRMLKMVLTAADTNDIGTDPPADPAPETGNS